MDRAAELAVLKDAVDEAMLLDAAEPGEVRGHHAGAEMNLVSGLDVSLCAGYGGLDAQLQFACGGHPWTG